MFYMGREVSVAGVSVVKYSFHKDMTLPGGDEIYVFGSNLKGIHGAGAARIAAHVFGAVRSLGYGPMGQCYAIPTKRTPYETLTLSEIRYYVEEFKLWASCNPRTKFFITRLGCGRAGFTDEDIAPMFCGSPPNCDFPEEWRRHVSLGL